MGSRGVLLDRRFSGIFFSIFWVFGDFRDGRDVLKIWGFVEGRVFVTLYFSGLGLVES